MNDAGPMFSIELSKVKGREWTWYSSHRLWGPPQGWPLLWRQNHVDRCGTRWTKIAV